MITPKPEIPIVVIESPYAGDVAGNLAYLTRCILDCAQRGESPYASHLMLTGALDDNNPTERALGIKLGQAVGLRADERVFYIDRGWSTGMQQSLNRYDALGLSYEVRRLDP